MKRFLCALFVSLAMVNAGVLAVELQETMALEVSGPYALAFSPEGSLLALAAGSGIQLLSTADYTLVETLVGHTATVTAVSFRPDGRRLASSSFDGSVRLWDVEEGEELRSIEGHNSWVRAVSFSPDGRLVGSGSLQEQVRWGLVLVSDAETGRPVLTKIAHEASVRAVAFSPDGSLLASGSDDRTVKVWDVRAGRELVSLPRQLGSINALAFSADGGRLFTAAWGEVSVWESESWDRVGRLQDHSGRVWALSLSPQAALLASGDDNGTVRIWNAESLELVGSVAAHDGCVRSLSFHPQGDLLASCGEDGVVKVWKMAPLQ